MSKISKKLLLSEIAFDLVQIDKKPVNPFTEPHGTSIVGDTLLIWSKAWLFCYVAVIISQYTKLDPKWPINVSSISGNRALCDQIFYWILWLWSETKCEITIPE